MIMIMEMPQAWNFWCLLMIRGGRLKVELLSSNSDVEWRIYSRKNQLKITQNLAAKYIPTNAHLYIIIYTN
jgi:hypothetical protein